MLERSQFHAGLALEPRQTMRVKVTAGVTVDWVRPSTRNAAQFSIYGFSYSLSIVIGVRNSIYSAHVPIPGYLKEVFVGEYHGFRYSVALFTTFKECSDN